MTTHCIAFGITILVAVQLCAQETDPIPAKIAAAKDNFYAERDKAEKVLLDALARKENTVKQAGDLKALEAVRAEIQAFRQEGVLPKLIPTTVYATALKNAHAKLQNSYAEAIKAYTRTEQLDKAKEIQQQLDDLRVEKNGSKIVPAADPLEVNSVWQNSNLSTGLTIKNRKDESFQGMMLHGKTEREVLGTIKEGKIYWFLKTGDGGDHHYGVISKDDKGLKMDVTWQDSKNAKRTDKFVMRLVDKNAMK
jgi:hypothetical protein